MTPEATIEALRARIAALEAEVEKLRSANVHRQGGWLSPFDPKARVPYP